jgi:hypothetical protein
VHASTENESDTKDSFHEDQFQDENNDNGVTAVNFATLAYLKVESTYNITLITNTFGLILMIRHADWLHLSR